MRDSLRMNSEFLSNVTGVVHLALVACGVTTNAGSGYPAEADGILINGRVSQAFADSLTVLVEVSPIVSRCGFAVRMLSTLVLRHQAVPLLVAGPPAADLLY